MGIVIPLDAFIVTVQHKQKMLTLNQWNLVSRGQRGVYTASSKKKQIESRIIPLFDGVEIDDHKNHWHFTWYLKDKRTDLDNISFMQKFVFDAAQRAGVIANDNLAQVSVIEHVFARIDKDDPRVEIQIGYM